MSMQSILSQQEKDLLASARPAGSGRKEQPFDPQRGLPGGARQDEELRAIHRIHREVANTTSAILSARLKTRVTLEQAADDPMTFSKLREAMAASGSICVNIVDMPPFGEGLLTLDMPTCFRFVDRCLGGSGRAPVPDRTFFTDIEMVTLDEVVTLILSGVQRPWSKILPDFDPQLMQRETDPNALALWSGTDRILTSSFHIVSEIVTGEMKICLPYSPVAEVLPRPGTVAYAQSGDNAAVPALEKRLQKVPLEVQAILAIAEIPVKDLLKLKVDDLIRTETPISKPIYLQVEGQTKFSARLGLVGKKYALKIDEVLPEVEE